MLGSFVETRKSFKVFKHQSILANMWMHIAWLPLLRERAGERSVACRCHIKLPQVLLIWRKTALNIMNVTTEHWWYFQLSTSILGLATCLQYVSLALWKTLVWSNEMIGEALIRWSFPFFFFSFFLEHLIYLWLFKKFLQKSS